MTLQNPPPLFHALFPEAMAWAVSLTLAAVVLRSPTLCSAAVTSSSSVARPCTDCICCRVVSSCAAQSAVALLSVASTSFSWVSRSRSEARPEGSATSSASTAAARASRSCTQGRTPA